MKTFQVITNSSCNLRCTYCYEYLDARKNNPKDIIQYLEEMVKLNHEVSDKNICLIDFIGGEPFFVPDVLDEVMGYCVSRYRDWGYAELRFTVSTNGTLLFKPKQLDIINRYKDFLDISVSIDGDKEKHDKHRLTIGGDGSFDDAKKGLDTLITILPKERIAIKSTFTKDSISDYSRCMKYLFSEYGNNVYSIQGNFNFEESFDVYDGSLIANEQLEVIRYLQSNTFFAEYLFISNSFGSNKTVGGQNPLVKPKIQRVMKNRCGSCNGMTSLGYNGEIYGCNRFSTMQKENVAMGKLENGNFQSYNNPLIEDIKHAYKEMPEWCQACRFNASCSDCVAIAIDEGISHHDYYRQNRMCGYTKASNLARLYNQLLYANRPKDIECLT